MTVLFALPLDSCGSLRELDMGSPEYIAFLLRRPVLLLAQTVHLSLLPLLLPL